jgi:serine/threonine protein kinase
VATGTGVRSDDRIGAYRYVRTILPGQNSVILEVVQESSGRHFALKEMLPTRALEKTDRQVFEIEAKLGMELRHPNLIRVHEFVKDKQTPYFVMDYFPSENMRIIINKKDRAPWLKERLHKIIEQVARALAYMHDKGWIHRDIKPENIIVNKSGEVRLIDYALAKRVTTGLAKLFAKQPPREGTHSYMSPEQILRLPPAVASDIYSFGVTCYELSCGRQPFRANSPTELLNKHLKEQPSPPTVHNRSITPEFSDLVMRMLKKKAADRPENLHEFVSQFARIRIYKDDPDPQAGEGGF